MDEILKKLESAFTRMDYSRLSFYSKNKTVFSIPTLLAAILLLICGFPSRITGLLLLLAVVFGSEFSVEIDRNRDDIKYTVDDDKNHSSKNDHTTHSDYNEYTVE